MTRAHQQRSVAVFLTAALLAVLAVVGGAHAAAHRPQRTSATPQHAASVGIPGTHHVTKHDAPSVVVHVDPSTGPAHPWSPATARGADPMVTASKPVLPRTSTSHDSRAPPTA